MKKIAIIITLAIFTLTGCQDEAFFELKRPVQPPWLTLDDFEKAPIGAYYGLSGNGGWRSIFAAGRIAGEVYADGVNLAPITDGFNTDGDVEDMYDRIGEFQISVFDNAVFNSGYFAVGFANGALDFIEENDGDPFPLANRPDEIDRIKGELLFVRAYAYYWLVRAYCPAYPNDQPRLPFRTSQARNFDEALTSPLASTNDIYALMESDLREAVAILPEAYDGSLHPPGYADGRATKFAAAALLAKVLFHKGDHQGALEPLNMVIDQNNGLFDLSEDPIEAFNKTGVNRGKEVIWYYTLWAGDGLGGPSNWKHPGRFEWYSASNRFAGGPANNQGRFIHSSESFLRDVGWKDENGTVTQEALNDKRFNQLFVWLTPAGSGINLAPNVYPEPNDNFRTTTDFVWGDKYYRAGDRITNLPILRLADMYLLRSIIRAQSGDTQGSLSDLNMVRNRAGLADFNGGGNELIEAIHLERFKEMAFEGDRLYYLQGLQMDIPAGDRGGAAVPYNGEFYSEIPDYERNVNLGYQ